MLAVRAVASILLFGVLAGACSAPAPNPGPCDPTKCAVGNACVDDGESVACRLLCNNNDGVTSMDRTQLGCPFNYRCVANIGKDATSRAEVNFCASDKPAARYSQKQSGQWGSPCNPANSPTPLEANPDCDFAQNFWCYGTSPTDGSAFCTQYQCADDADCRQGWWCARVNAFPDVRSVSPLFDHSAVQSVCVPRAWNLTPGTYCAPCANDLDCPRNQGNVQHCTDLGSGETVCAAECRSDTNCPLDAKCVDGGLGTLVCEPRAGTCKGDGSLCSPCHSHADCKDPAGGCVGADYSTEKFCTTKSAAMCSVSFNMCPPAPAGAAGGGIGCVSSVAPGLPPRDSCVGLVKLAMAGVLGCWTRPR